MQFAYKNFWKKEKTGKNEQKSHEITVYGKKEKTINYCIFVDTSSNWWRMHFCSGWKKEEKCVKTGEIPGNCKGMYDKKCKKIVY